MNTMILVVIGTLWSALISVATWILKGHVDAGRVIAIAAHAETLRIERREAGKLLVQLNRDYAALQTQHDQAATKNAALAAQCNDMIARNVELVAQVTDRDEAIAALRLQLAEATSKKSEHAQLTPKPQRASKIKAE